MTYNVFSGTLNPTQSVSSRFMTFFNMTCLGVVLLVRGHDGTSTRQNGAAAYSQSEGAFAFSVVFVFPNVLLLW